MAKVKGMAATKYIGSLGPQVFYMRNGQNIVREKAASVSNPQTEAQMNQRIKWGNVINLYRLNKSWMEKYAFPIRPEKQSVYNAFMSANVSGSEAALTKEKYQQGVTILEPLDFTKGTLPQMLLEYVPSIPGFVSDIEFTGADENETIGSFTYYLLRDNSWLRDGDQLSIIFNVTDAQGLHPKVAAFEITLDSNSNVVFASTEFGGIATMDEVSGEGRLAFAIDQLPSGFVEDNGIVGAVFVVSRNTANGMEVTTSRMELDTYSLLNLYNSPAARRSARRSYGSSDSQPFLVPNPTTGVGFLDIESVNGLLPSNATLLTQARNAAMTIVVDGSFDDLADTEVTLDMNVAYASDDASEFLGGTIELHTDLLTDPNVTIVGNMMTIGAAAWAGKFPTTAQHPQGVDSVNPYSVSLAFNAEFSSTVIYKDLRSNP